VLWGRRSECEALDRLLEAVRAGEGRVLVLRGEPGVGKTALLQYVVGQASGCRVARAVGVQSEMELAFAGLHQLCAPMLDRLERLPGPQRDALGTAFGLSAGTAPDRFLVGLAVLSLLSEVAEERPLVCLVDDAQWLDRASAQALAFVARRLLAESVALVFAARESGEKHELTGLPELVVEGLRDADARALLSSVISGPLDERVRDRIVAETRGNPLALLELPRGLTPAELAGGFGLPDALALSGRIEESFRRRLAPLPPDTRRLLLVAAAEPVGEPALVWRAAERLGIRSEAAAPATAAGLLEFGARVRFRHPLVRSAVYRAASPNERRGVHRALADATDPEVDPDRRAWHLAHATSGPDDEVAAELERSAGRAQARGGLAAAAAFLEQAAGLTRSPARRGERALAAAQAKHQAGAFDAALGLLATAEAGPLDEIQRARVDLLRGQIAFASNRGGDAAPLLLKAAKQLEPLDVTLARETYLDALSAAMFAGRLAPGPGVLEVAEAARAARRAGSSPQAPRAPDLLLDGLALLITEGYPAGTPMLKRALSAFGSEDISREEGLRWLWLACRTALDLWDDESWYVLSTRQVQLARDAGALAVLPIALESHVGVHLHAGELAAAAALVEEVGAVTEATGSRLAPYGAMLLAAWRGRKAEFSELMEATTKEVVPRGEGMGLAVMRWASALLYNGLGEYEDALAAAQEASAYPHDSTWVLHELIEAAVRSGKVERAADVVQRLSEMTRASGTEWALGIEARSRALLSEGEAAESLHGEAIDWLGRTRVPVELARAHLLYGEWLRRERRRLDAREQLRTAHEMFTAMGMEAFARRAARELLATGETARRRSVETRGELTAQESQIARLARDGLSNPEIGARLFISPRTVEYHLGKVFGKLDISSRNQLDRVLSSDPSTAHAV
jgi:DNA-binding CsgD family transcriptional regulator